MTHRRFANEARDILIAQRDDERAKIADEKRYSDNLKAILDITRAERDAACAEVVKLRAVIIDLLSVLPAIDKEYGCAFTNCFSARQARKAITPIES